MSHSAKEAPVKMGGKLTGAQGLGFPPTTSIVPRGCVPDSASSSREGTA